ncbi:Protein slit like protein [Argiope bruennichi]|uniref:Protein slit like protein n=1 Tax=Argiope bruennichi TaxID=94029 RepID=A0A8T0E935_ARGBR|nr:Protein slit like protein [Argiope bruennichi]
MFQKGAILLFLAVVVHKVIGEKGCPEREEISPCTCREMFLGQPKLTCKEITQVDTLKTVFQNARRYRLTQFTLVNSTLQYIPHEVFDDVKVKNLEFEKVTFVKTFDKIPENPGVVTIKLTEVRVIGGWDWSKLSLFKQLRDLTISDIPMKRLSSDFRPNISKKLEKLRLSWCKVKKLRDDEFQEFKDLEVFVATHDELTTLKRTMFARPSKLKELGLEYNRISSIPANMFEDMPYLDFLGLSHNQLTFLPIETYRPVIDHLTYLRLVDNPLRCDCLIQWLTFKKVPNLYGECATPLKFEGKDLNDLKPQDFRC